MLFWGIRGGFLFVVCWFAMCWRAHSPLQTARLRFFAYAWKNKVKARIAGGWYPPLQLREDAIEAPLCKGRDALSKQHGVLLVAKAGSNAMLATGAEGWQHRWLGDCYVVRFCNFTIPPSCVAIHLPLHKGGIFADGTLFVRNCFCNQNNAWKVNPIMPMAKYRL